jgi:hypothetical protein
MESLPGDVVIKPYPWDNSMQQLWQSVRQSFRGVKIPTWSEDGLSSGANLGAGWTASDYAMDKCCSLRINDSVAFQRAHELFEGLSHGLFSLRTMELVCSFATKYSTGTNQNLAVHTDHPNGVTVTFQGPIVDGANSELLIYDDSDGSPSREIGMPEGTACCFDANLRHATAAVQRGERWVWVLFYGPGGSGSGSGSGHSGGKRGLDCDSDGDLEPPRKAVPKKRKALGDEPRLCRSIAERYRESSSVRAQFLPVPGVMDEETCAALLEGVCALHRPQVLRYEGASANGLSYKNSWKISTYAWTREETYVHRFFSETVGAPYDEPMLNYIRESGVLDLLCVLKRGFLQVKLAHLSTEMIEQAIEEMTLSQMFLTVQPSTQAMRKADSFMQPHIDPSSLTINLHLSPADFKGCPPAEGGLLVFGTDGHLADTPLVVPTPKGSAMFIWNEPTSSCLHTANEISAGERVVLCSFWQQPKAASPSPITAPDASALPVPVRTAVDGAAAVPTQAPCHFAEHGCVALQWQDIDGIVAAFAAEAQAVLPDAAQLGGTSDGTGAPAEQPHYVELLDRAGAVRRARTDLACFATMRAQLVPPAVRSEIGSITGFTLRSLPALIARLAPEAARRGVFFFNEQCVSLPGEQRGAEHGSGGDPHWKSDQDELPFSCLEFVSVWFPLSDGASTVLVTTRGGGAELAFQLTRGQALVLSSQVEYCLVRGSGRRLFACVQYSFEPLESSPGGAPIAFAVPCGPDSCNKTREPPLPQTEG